jgi:hypothetical protein
MASGSKSTEMKRKNRNRNQGKDRKKKLAREGSTRSEAELFGNTLNKAASR